MTTILFRSATDDETGFLSSYYEDAPFKLDGETWQTLRHWYNASKFVGHSHVDFKAAQEANSPIRADKIGQDRFRTIRRDWDAVKIDVMLQGISAVFEQHPDLADKLVATGDDRLIYQTGRDTFWGCGSKRDGKNKLGQLLMDVRSDLVSARKGGVSVVQVPDLTVITQSVLDALPADTEVTDLGVFFPTIYKQRSDGGFQQSQRSVVWTGTNPEMVTEHGQVNGVMQRTPVEVLEAKSQASVWDQAVFEMRAKWQKKVDSGYALEMTAHADLDFRPMLAKKWDARKKAILKLMAKGLKTLHVQAKLDGIRGNFFWKDGEVFIQSRTGKDITAGKEHLIECFAEAFADFPNIVVDGEIYKHGVLLQDISGAARRGDSDKAGKFSASDLQFVVYDMYHTDDADFGYEDRFYSHEAYEVLQRLTDEDAPIISIESLFETRSFTDGTTFEEDVVDAHREAVDAGFEGVILRVDSEPYKLNGRSSGLIKYKTFMDIECDIVDITTPETGAMAGQAIFWCECPAFGVEGNEIVRFKATPIGDVATREAYYNDRDNIIGLKEGTVKFHAYTKDGKPFHANFVAIRDYE